MHTVEKKKTFVHFFSLRGTVRNLPSSSWATWHYELFATPLLGSENSGKKSTFPAVSTGSTLQVNLLLHLHLSCLCRSTCSVLSETICWKDVGKATSPGTFHLKPIQVNSDSYDNFTNLTMLLNSCNFQQRQMHAAEKKKTFNHFSLRGTLWNLPSSSWATWHYELFATPLLGSDYSSKKTTLPAAATGSTLQVNLRLHMHLACLCRSSCSVLSETICWKDVGKATSPGTFHLKPIQVNSNSYTTTSQNLTMPLNSCNFQQRQIHVAKNKKTFAHVFSLRGTRRNLPSSTWATWHYELFATPLLGSENSRLKATLPAAATGSTLQVNLRLHMHLACLCRSSCSVLSESICWKDVGKARSAGIQPILNPSRSTPTHIRQLHKSDDAPKLVQLPTETNTHRRKQENLQPFFSARHEQKFAFFKLSHLAPLSLCHAPAWMREQPWRSKETKLQHCKVVKNSKTPRSSPCSSDKLWIKWSRAVTGRCTGHLKSTRYRKVAGVRLPVSTLM